MMRVAVKSSNNVVYMLNLRDEITNDPVIDADISCTIYDVYGNPVSGQTWPLSLVYQDGTDGDYMGVLDDAIALDVGKYYKAVVTVVVGDTNPTKLVETHELEVVERLP